MLRTCLDYLERELPADGFLFDALGTADFAIAAPFRNAAFARFTIDARRWPRSAAYVARVLDSPPLAGLRAWEGASQTTPPPRLRQALAAPISAKTWGSDQLPCGVMRI